MHSTVADAESAAPGGNGPALWRPRMTTVDLQMPCLPSVGLQSPYFCHKTILNSVNQGFRCNIAHCFLTANEELQSLRNGLAKPLFSFLFFSLFNVALVEDVKVIQLIKMNV